MFEAENDIKKHFRYVSFNSERNPDVNRSKNNAKRNGSKSTSLQSCR